MVVGVSETILAAMIGAIATVSTALFQLFSALRNKGKVDTRPKRGMTLRSVLAVFALMVASAAGGFLYSEFIKQRAGEDLRAMRAELKELKDLTARVAAERDEPALRAAQAMPASSQPNLTPTSLNGPNAVESVVYVPACRRGDSGAPCTESEAQRVALCGAVPSFARVDRIELFVQPDAVQHAWDQHRAELEQDVGGARFTGKSFEYAQSQDQKAVCVNFVHWSSDHPHIARILVQYGFGEPSGQSEPDAVEEPPAESRTPTIVSADAMSPIPQAAAFSETIAR